MHHVWCMQLKRFYSGILQKLLRKYFVLLSTWTRNTHANRTFVRNRRLRYIKSGFRCFRSNVLLNRFVCEALLHYSVVISKCLCRHLLQVKLRSSSTLTFSDYFYRRVCFFKWTRYRQFAKRLDMVDELVENVLLKDALVRWVLMTWAPRRKYTIQERAAQMRESIEKSLLLLCNRAGDAVKPIAVGIRNELSSSSAFIRQSVRKQYEQVLKELRPRIMKLLTSEPYIDPAAIAAKKEQARKEKLRKLRVHNAIKYANELLQASEDDINGNDEDPSRSTPVDNNEYNEYNNLEDDNNDDM